MDQNTFDVTIDHFQKFAREIFSPGCEDKFKVKLMEALEQIMKMGKSLNIEKVENMQSNPGKRIKLDQTPVLELPNEIWTKIFKYITVSTSLIEDTVLPTLTVFCQEFIWRYFI